MDVLRRALAAFRAFADRHPRAVRIVVVLAFFAAVLPSLNRLVPRERTLVYDLGAAHGSYTMLRLAYVVRGQDTARVLTLRFPNGAPREYVHRTELPRGSYEIHARLTGPDEVEEVVRYVDVDVADRIEVRLEQTNPLSRTEIDVDPPGGAPRRPTSGESGARQSP